MTSFIHCFATAPFSPGVPVTLLDVTTLTPITIPAGTYVKHTYFQSNNFTVTTGILPLTITGPAAASLAVGWNGSPNIIVPSNGGISTTGLNAADMMYTPVASSITNSSSQTLVLTAGASVTTGTVNIILETSTFAGFP